MASSPKLVAALAVVVAVYHDFLVAGVITFEVRPDKIVPPPPSLATPPPP
jgi:hypothetical protein